MKVSIRKRNSQESELTVRQIKFAASSICNYVQKDLNMSYFYNGCDLDIDFSGLQCEVYRTKTQISAIVYFK